MGIAVNPVTNKFYVANHNGSAPLSVIDGVTNNVIMNIPVAKNVWGVAVNPNRNLVYVTVSPRGTPDIYLEVIDGATGGTRGAFRVPLHR